jgi:hypothetical protein
MLLPVVTSPRSKHGSEFDWWSGVRAVYHLPTQRVIFMPNAMILVVTKPVVSSLDTRTLPVPEEFL